MRLYGLSTALLAALHATAAAAALTVSNTILVLARDSTAANVATLGLQGYGIPYETLLVPSTGAVLPKLNSSTTHGNYGGILVLSEVSYQYATGFFSAIATSQWDKLYAYQKTFGVRMVRLDVYPTDDFGTPPSFYYAAHWMNLVPSLNKCLLLTSQLCQGATTDIAGTGCCATNQEQYMRITDSSAFATANIKTCVTLGLFSDSANTIPSCSPSSSTKSSTDLCYTYIHMGYTAAST